MSLIVSVLPSDLARTRGGGERYAFELHKALHARLPGWSALGLVAATARGSELVPDGWQAVRPTGRRQLPSADAIPARTVLELVPRSATIVICHQWRTRATAALRVRRGLSWRGRLLAIDYGGGSIAGYRLARLPLPRADVGAHISDFEATVSPIKARSHCVIRGGIDPNRFGPPDEERRDYDFLMVGRFLPHKGQLVFLDGLPRGARALLIGPSDSDDLAYLNAVKRRAAETAVDLLFDLPDDELMTAYQRSRYTVQVPVVPVHRRRATPPELLGLTMLEAMACGSVPICPATGASSEFVRHGVTGLTYELGSTTALSRVLREAFLSDERRTALQQGAVTEVQRWTWTRAVDSLLSRL